MAADAAGAGLGTEIQGAKVDVKRLRQGPLNHNYNQSNNRVTRNTEHGRMTVGKEVKGPSIRHGAGLRKARHVRSQSSGPEGLIALSLHDCMAAAVEAAAAPAAEALRAGDGDSPEAGPLTADHVLGYWAHVQTSLEEAASYLSGLLALPDYQRDALSAIRLDMAAYTLTFAQEAGHGPHCTVSLLQVAQSLLDACTNGASIESLEATFKMLMLQRTSAQPGPDSGKFSPDQVAVIAQFFVRTFFRHARLYQHCLTQPQEVAECSVDLMVETAMVPSFEGAFSEEEWHAAQTAAAAAAEAAARAQAEAAASAEVQAANAAAEAAAQAAERERQEQLSKKPATLEEAVEHMVALRLDAERQVLAAEYQSKEEQLLKKIAELETRAQQPTKK